jgi:class 3 adenylate cyclase
MHPPLAQSERTGRLPARSRTETAAAPSTMWRRTAQQRGGDLRQPGPPRAGEEVTEILATVAFIDIVKSTEHLAQLGDRRWLQMLGEYQALVRSRLPEFGGREVKALGDGFLVLFELPAQGIRCIDALRASTPELQLVIRAGVHAGEVELQAADVYGLSVHITERICTHAKPNEILASRTVKELTAGSAIAFVDRGLRKLKGVPGRWRLYAAEPRDP